MSMRMSVNIREFKQAMAFYARETGKTEPEVCNRAARNVALRTVQRLPKAVAKNITALQEQPWWPKMIAKILSNRKSSNLTTFKKRDRKKLARTGRFYTVPVARRVSKKMISGRRKSVSFMKSAWLRAAKPFGDIKGKPKGTVQRATGEGKLAVVGHPIASMIVEYIGDSRRDALAKRKIALKALSSAIQFVTKDMTKHAMKLHRQHARAISAR